MNKIILALSLCALSSASWASPVTPCTSGVAQAVTAATPTNNFIKADFTPKCSANTVVKYDESANSAAVAGISTKGNEVFSGHTAGGAVTKSGTCPTTGCVAGTVDTPLSDALTASSS